MKQETGDFLANHQRNRRDWVKETSADVTAAVKKRNILVSFKCNNQKKRGEGEEFWGEGQ